MRFLTGAVDALGQIIMQRLSLLRLIWDRTFALHFVVTQYAVSKLWGLLFVMQYAVSKLWGLLKDQGFPFGF